jgi:hypothetical protein
MHHHAIVAAISSRTSTANLIVSSAPPAVNRRVPVIFLQYSVLEEKTKPETQSAKDMPGDYPVLRVFWLKQQNSFGNILIKPI